MAEPVLKTVGARAQPYASAGPPVVTSTTDGDTFLEPGERAVVSLPVTNSGDATARSVSVELQSTTPGVGISPLSQSYGTLAAGAEVRRPFAVTVARATPLGSRVSLAARVSFQGAFSPQTRVGFVVVGEPSPITTDVAYSGPPVAIPDETPAGVSVSIPVTGVGTVSRATFSLDGTSCDTAEGSTTVGLDHTYTGDLVGTLTSPNGTAVQLFNRAEWRATTSARPSSRIRPSGRSARSTPRKLRSPGPGGQHSRSRPSKGRRETATGRSPWRTWRRR